MIGDRARSITARNLIHVRAKREQHFPPGIFDEHAWNMLLHLFIDIADNRVMNEARLIELSGTTTSVARRWISYLLANKQIKDREDGDDILLTEDSISSMRHFLDAAKIIHTHEANGSIYGT